MSDKNPHDPHTPDGDGHDHLGSGASGYENEGDEGLQAEPSEQRQAVKSRKSDKEWKNNLNAVFGHGIGKIALICVGAVVVLGVVLGVRGMTRDEVQTNNSSARVEVPKPPASEVSLNPVSESEAIRRSQISEEEARKATAAGKSYQPGFDTNIVPDSKAEYTGEQTAFKLPTGNSTPPPAPPPLVISAGQGPTPAAHEANSQASEQERQRIEAEYRKAISERDKYVSDLRSEVLKQVGSMMRDSKSSKGFNDSSGYSAVSYAVEKPVAQQTVAGRTPAAANDPDRIAALGDRDNLLLIKTGSMMYATLDSEINTDDGGDVLATVRGGKWNGAKLLGKVEQAPNNIRVRFNTLAPSEKDPRPVMRINAVALREDDAKQGVAETIDHPTLERYTALGAASLLSGYGKAYSQIAGTTVISPSGVVAQTTTEPSNKQVMGSAIGEMGSAISSEVRRGFNRPTTYATPANKGFGVFFLQDVHEPKQ